MGKSANMKYLRNCVSWPPEDVNAKGGLCDMINKAMEVGRETFLRNVDTDDLYKLEDELGYFRKAVQGPTMASDWHVSYHRSKLHGRKVYYFRHSAIEYVFVPPEHAAEINDAIQCGSVLTRAQDTMARLAFSMHAKREEFEKRYGKAEMAELEGNVKEVMETLVEFRQFLEPDKPVVADVDDKTKDEVLKNGWADE